jgi:hypothetical protein
MRSGAALSRRRASIAAALALVASCQRDVFIGADTSRDGVSADAGVDAAAPKVDAAKPDVVVPCVEVTCEGAVLACGNCRDDDGDGKVDMDDPDCLGPCHLTEDNFSNPHPGPDRCVKDCYFDGNAGFDDGCLWSHACDAAAPTLECPYDENTNLPQQATCASTGRTQSAACGATCLPLTPNGCDCFGCCEVFGASTPVWLGSVDDRNQSTCDLEHAADPTRCKPCTQVTSCLNRCDPCERCIGKTELPAGCNPGGGCPTPTCDRGAPCGSPCLPPCSPGQSCVTGCCVDPPR